MSEFERINAKRFDDILTRIDQIERSANSLKAGDEMAELMAPVRERLGLDAPIIRRAALDRPTWDTAQEFAATLKLRDVGHVFAVLTSRIDEALDDAGFCYGGERADQ